MNKKEKSDRQNKLDKQIKVNLRKVNLKLNLKF